MAGKLGLLGLGLCAACCALPVLGLIGGAGIVTSLALYTKKIAIFLLAISFIGIAVWLFKRHKHVCSIDCRCKELSTKNKPLLK